MKSFSESVNVIHIYNQVLLLDGDEFGKKLFCNFEYVRVLKLNQLPKFRLYKRKL